MAKQILIKPIISEKSELLSAKSDKYSFVVNKDANKLEIRKAVEEMFEGVKVKKVNTMVMPAKTKTRNTRSGVQKGRVSSYKKAIVTLQDGHTIDYFGEI